MQGHHFSHIYGLLEVQSGWELGHLLMSGRMENRHHYNLGHMTTRA